MVLLTDDWGERERAPSLEASYVSQTAHARYSRDLLVLKIGVERNRRRSQMFRDHSFNIIFTFQLWVTEHTHLLSQRKKRMAVHSPAKDLRISIVSFPPKVLRRKVADDVRRSLQKKKSCRRLRRCLQK